jgi:hypothetical protein
MSRKSKLIQSFNNVFRKEELAHNVRAYQKYGINKNYFSPVSNKDLKNITAERNWLEVNDSRRVLHEMSAFQKLKPSIQKSLLNWSDLGYVIIENFFPDNVIDEINRIVDELIVAKKVHWKFKNRVMNTVLESDYLFNIGMNETLVAILELLLGRSVVLYQTMNFNKGSEQRPHTDAISVTTFPLGNIIAVWLALEDMIPENGPFHYFPGSHKLPYIMNEDFDNQGTMFSIGDKTHRDYEDKIQEVIEQNGSKKEVFLAKKSDLMIWHANLIHGGEPHLDKSRTRKSMVFHYAAKDVVCYHEITQSPMRMPKDLR